MDSANYLNNQGSYPVSAETFDFIQGQINFVAQLTSSLGKNVIIKDSSSSEKGLVIFEGELLPLVGDKSDFITIREKVVSITAKGTTYEDARKMRTAEYTHIANGENSKLVGYFEVVNEEARRQHYVPKGAIMMWSGAVGNIPAGWALCDGANGTPDLRGRFVVGYDASREDYAIGKTGGKAEVWLTAEQSGLPEHTHTVEGPLGRSGETGMRGSNYLLGKSGSFTTTGAKKDAAKAHENRPPYYALAYIMKTV